MKNVQCIMDGCSNTLGPKSLVIKHQEEVTSFICDLCLGELPALKLHMKKNEEGYLEIDQVIPIPSPL